MLDQSFSADNFRKILNDEGRKGIYVEDNLSMVAVVSINQQIKDCSELIRDAKMANNWPEVNRLYEQKKDLRDQKEETLQKELTKAAAVVTSKGFQFVMNKVEIFGLKPIYISQRTPDQFFAIKQTQINLSRLYCIKQANRDIIVEQLKALLGDEFPKFIIRTDIKDFYESIPRNIMLSTIDDSYLLSSYSRIFLRKILEIYYAASGSPRGIPRGIGISAYLAELYMRDIDRRIREIPGLTYFARYVDDIIAIFTPIPGEVRRYYRREIKNSIEHLTNLKINTEKTQVIDLRTEVAEHDLDYLGYKFTFGRESTITTLSDKKFKKYKYRLKKSFDQYQHLGKVDEPLARSILVKRIRFLTGNTRLANNKKHILTGVYYSNKQLDTQDDFDNLDVLLNRHIRTIRSTHLRKRLRKYKFVDGFTNRRFSPFRTHELEEITKIWKPKSFR